MIENHAVIHRAHPAVPPLHLLVPHLVLIRIVAAKIYRRVVVQVIVAV
jgi:hypothetical protein